MARGNFGERLKREREMREVSLEEITAATRIGTRFLEALEKEEWEKLPGGIFNRGFVRAMAHYLGLDEESFLAEYDLAFGQRAASQSQPPPPAPSSDLPARLFPAVKVIVAFVVLVVGGYYGWKRLRKLRPAHEFSATVPAPSADTPGVIASAPGTAEPVRPSPSTATPTAPASPALHLGVSASEPVHASVLADGKIVFDNDLSAGETVHFDAQNEFVVSAGNSTAVLLELNGQTMPPIGAPGASGRIVLTSKDLERATGGNSQP